MNTPIVISSGFLIPKNVYYTPVQDEDPAYAAIFDRNGTSSNTFQTKQFFKNKQVHKSESITKNYMDYVESNSFDDFIVLVNIVIDVMKDVEFNEFFKTQIANNYLSLTSIQFCKEILTGKFIQNYKNFSVIPCNLRFSNYNDLTTDQVNKLLNDIDRNNTYIQNWESFLSSMYENRNAFATFFRYIFVDIY